MTDFLKVLYYFENLEFQEYHETERSTTSIKTQGDLYPHEVVVSVLMDSSVNTIRKTGPWSNKIKQMRKQNTEDTQYNRDTDLRGSPSVGYVHQRNCQVLPLLLSNK
jgi:hypothetical protein